MASKGKVPAAFIVQYLQSRLKPAMTTTVQVIIDDPSPSLVFIRVKHGKPIKKKFTIAKCELEKGADDRECLIHVRKSDELKSEKIVVFKTKSDREIGRAVQQECRDRSRMPSSA
eukprot:TRINITY_DN8470_c0_g1_i2.p1 TRINITY_DN8470_c0_g1~~TRINITY_DN8470_c0_g1_i2.p1  ORF type:complete len:115 (-),score=21.85 TRINITY_DN8470_c0_g1_i2:11-355(-)